MKLAGCGVVSVMLLVVWQFTCLVIAQQVSHRHDLEA